MVKIGGANLGIVKIEAIHCYMCGKIMTNKGDSQKTQHHAIPQKFKPIRNIIMPICGFCHKRLHRDIPEITTPKLKDHIKKLEHYFGQFQNHIERLKEEANK